MISQDGVDSPLWPQFLKVVNARLDPAGMIDKISCQEDEVDLERGETVKETFEEKSLFGEVKIGKVENGQRLSERLFETKGLAPQPKPIRLDPIGPNPAAESEEQ